MSAIPVVPAWFTHRLDRSRFIAGHLRKYVAGKVLDVGCDEAHLRTLVPGIEYTGIDVGGKPDLRIDLEATERLPFDDRAFDSVLCSDVLEHLDNLHRVFGELARVTRRWLVISLPNNWTNARRPIERRPRALSPGGRHARALGRIRGSRRQALRRSPARLQRARCERDLCGA